MYHQDITATIQTRECHMASFSMSVYMHFYKTTSKWSLEFWEALFMATRKDSPPPRPIVLLNTSAFHWKIVEKQLWLIECHPNYWTPKLFLIFTISPADGYYWHFPKERTSLEKVKQQEQKMDWNWADSAAVSIYCAALQCVKLKELSSADRIWSVVLSTRLLNVGTKRSHTI